MSDYVLRFLKIYDVGSFPNLSMFEKRFEKFWTNPYPSISSDIRKLGPGHVRRSETLRSRLAAIDSLAKTNLEIQICDRLRTTIIYICVYICIYNVYIYIHMFITDSGFENHLASLGVSPFSGTKPYQIWTKPMCQAGTAQPLTEGAALHRLSPKRKCYEVLSCGTSKNTSSPISL